MSKKQELIDFIMSLTDEEVNKLSTRLDYLKSFTDDDVKKLETVKPTAPKPTISTREPSLPFQRKSETTMPFQKVKR